VYIQGKLGLRESGPWKKGDTLHDEERETNKATMRTGIYYLRKTWRLQGSRPAPSKENTDATIHRRQDGDKASINRQGIRRCMTCGDADCPCFRICACGGVYGVKTTVERVVG